MHFRITLAFGLIALSQTGCVSTTSGSATEFARAQSVLSPVTNRSAVSQADLRLSCKEIDQRLSNFYARFDEIEAAEKKRQRQNAVTGAIGDVATAVIGGRLIGGLSGGGINGLRTATAAQTAITSMRGIEMNSTDLRTVNDATAISQRAGDLERAKVEKGCAG